VKELVVYLVAASCDTEAEGAHHGAEAAVEGFLAQGFDDWNDLLIEIAGLSQIGEGERGATDCECEEIAAISGGRCDVGFMVWGLERIVGNGAGFDGEEKVFWCCVCAEVEVVAGAGVLARQTVERRLQVRDRARRSERLERFSMMRSMTSGRRRTSVMGGGVMSLISSALIALRSNREGMMVDGIDFPWMIERLR